MKINYYKTYIDTIKWSVWSKQYRNFWISKWWIDIDICQDGNLSCAYFVSNILKQFNLISAWSVNVWSTEKLLLQKWRKIIDKDTQYDQIPIWSILVYEWWFGVDGFHTHVGFVIWDEMVVSNNSRQETQTDQEIRTIAEHHYTYNWTREITNIYTYDFDHKIDWLFHEELEVKIYGQTEEYINEKWENWLNDEDLERSLWKNDWLKSWRLCWLACILSAINYFGKNSQKENQSDNSDNIYIDKKYSDLISYRNQQYIYSNIETWEKTNQDIYIKGGWWAHGGLLHIAKKFGINGNIYTEDMSNMTWSQIISMIYNNIKQNKLTILSVDVDMWSGDFAGRKGWHLVMILGIDYNGSEYSLMIWNPLSPKHSQRVNIDRFMQWFGWKWMLLYR